MSAHYHLRRLACIGFLSVGLNGCFTPPYNQFREDPRALRDAAIGTGVGAGLGAIIGSAASGNPATGAVIGGAVGMIAGVYHSNQIIKKLQTQHIQFVQHGDTLTLIVPTDHYFVFNSPRINELCYPGLNNIIRLLKYYPCSPIYVAGFSDNVGSRHHKNKLSQAQAEAMLTFLWANNIQAQRLHAEGLGEKYPLGDNQLIHASAYNRRIEIQWLTGAITPASADRHSTT